MKKKRIEIFARLLAYDVLKAYHREIKSTHPADTSAVEREKGQAAAFAVTEKNIREFMRENGGTDALCIEMPDWLDGLTEEEEYGV